MEAAPAPAPLSHLRVLELPGGVATRYCGRLFAQLGATVVAAGPDRDTEPAGLAAAGGAYARWLDAGKQRGPATARAVADADLVIAGQDEDAVARARELIAAAGAGAPALLAIWWFDPRGPYGRWHGGDEVILALSGLAYGFGLPQGPPMLARGHAPQVVAGVTAFTAAVAALLPPPADRPGEIEVNVLESFVCLSEAGAVAARHDPDVRSARLGVNRFNPTYPCSSYRSRDGWIGVTCLTPAQWHSLCELIGRPEASSDPELATAVSRLRHAEEVDALLAPALARRTSAEWVAAGLAGRIPIVAMPRPHELPDQEHWRQRGSFAPLPETTVSGPALSGPVLSGPALSGRTLSGPAVSAPTLPFRYAHDGVTGPGVPAEAATAAAPLGGVRVADFTMGWAGPLATRMLADLGADVIKVESQAHPDWWRGWEAGDGGDVSRRELRPNFNTVNRGKRGVSLDLTTEPGRAAGRTLVAESDVVIENFAAGVLAKLGLGLDVQRELRPGVISLAMPAFGGSGPLAGTRAYGSTVEQASGLPFVNGEESWPPCLQHVAFGDPIAGLYAAAAIVTAVAGRDRLGGTAVDLSQVACLFELGADAIIGAQLTGGQLPRTGNRRPEAGWFCVVPAAGPDEWLAVAAGSAPARRALARVLGLAAGDADRGVAADAGLAGDSGGAAGDADLAGAGDEEWARRAAAVEAAVAEWARGRPAAQAAAVLQEAGVPAAPVLPAHALGADPQLTATGVWPTMEREYAGRHTVAAAVFRFDGRRPPLTRPAPTLGQHTAELLPETERYALCPRAC
jgi:crotonobetainyl-CoA:carnitine CoA-transferase CaiB-like acyl-CoA transferase